MSKLLEKKIEEFEKDGVVLLRNLFSLKWLKKLEKGVEDIMQNPSPISREYMKSGSGRFYTDHHMSKRNKKFYDFLMDSPANKTAGKLLKSTSMDQIEKIGDRWFPMRFIFKDELKKNSKGTEWKIITIQFDVDIPKDMFTKSNLLK